MTHGFDDQGSLYDEHGNRRDWFSPQDRANFNRMTSCEVKEYNDFEAAPGLKLDGQLSLGENTADNGGMRIAYRAFEDLQTHQPSDQSNTKSMAIPKTSVSSSASHSHGVRRVRKPTSGSAAKPILTHRASSA